MKINFVRHGKPDYTVSAERRLPYALKNYCPLARDGISGVEEAARDPRLASAEVMLVSPYTRAMQTAEIVNRVLGLPLFVEYDLREWDVASDYTEYVSEEEALRRYREFRDNNGVPPAGTQGSSMPLYETGESVKKRAMAVLERYRGHDRIVVVAHGTLIRSVTGPIPDVPLCGIVEWDM